MTWEQLCSESTPPASHGRRLTRLHQAAVTRMTTRRLQGKPLHCCKNVESHWLASCYECSAQYPAGAPGFKQTALFRAPHSPACYEEVISSPPLLAPASPLQEEFPSLCIRQTQIPWSSVILTTVNICYSGCLRISTSHRFIDHLQVATTNNC
jgi:hypothetical protein